MAAAPHFSWCRREAERRFASRHRPQGALREPSATVLKGAEGLFLTSAPQDPRILSESATSSQPFSIRLSAVKTTFPPPCPEQPKQNIKAAFLGIPSHPPFPPSLPDPPGTRIQLIDTQVGILCGVPEGTGMGFSAPAEKGASSPHLLDPPMN